MTQTPQREQQHPAEQPDAAGDRGDRLRRIDEAIEHIGVVACRCRSGVHGC
ncbi:MAG: hypothetical protein ACE367_15545 [Acidimicrobiales bacterium]